MRAFARLHSPYFGVVYNTWPPCCVAEFSESVLVSSAAESPDEELLRSCQAVVVAGSGGAAVPQAARLATRCRAAGASVVLALALGATGHVFVDHGDSFAFDDPTGEPPATLMVESITRDSPAVITVAEDHRHGLEPGDCVTFSGLQGMTALNVGEPRPATVTGPSSFTIPDDTRRVPQRLQQAEDALVQHLMLEPHRAGGYIHRHRPATEIHFDSYTDSLSAPALVHWDPARPGRSCQLHATFQAVAAFYGGSHGGAVALPPPTAEDLLQLVSHAAPSRDGAQPATSNGSVRPPGSTSRDCSTVSHGDSNGAAAAPSHDNRAEEPSLPNEALLHAVAAGMDVDFAPLIAILGGIAAQEAVKACTRRHTPIRQWLHLDVLDSLPDQWPNSHPALEQQLAASKWLVVGAGAIGCEAVKTMVLMGVGARAEGGAIVLADSDRVARSNLPSQCLFRTADLGQHKAAAAAAAVRGLRPSANIVAIAASFVGEGTGDTAPSAYLSRISGVLSAVDTARARLDIDAKCVLHRVPLIDGGKHGTKGSVQAFVPRESEMYASTQDPPEHREPQICTLKNFPYSVEHAVLWAADLFDSLFKRRPEDVNAYLSSKVHDPTIPEGGSGPPSSRVPLLETLRDALLRHRPLGFEACMEWARLLFEDLFSNAIKQLGHNFPPGMTTSAGAPFWSGTKRFPAPLSFSLQDPCHMDFVVAAANLQATVYGLRGCKDRTIFAQFLSTVVVPPFEPKDGVRIAVTDAEDRGLQQKAGLDSKEVVDAKEACRLLFQELPTPASLAVSSITPLLYRFLCQFTCIGYRLSPIDYDPDDEQYFHNDFVTAAAWLRAANYGIPQPDRLAVQISTQAVARSSELLVRAAAAAKQQQSQEASVLQLTSPSVDKSMLLLQARVIAGRIIPAVITTAAVAGGLMCLELCKSVLAKPLAARRHTFFSLALGMFVPAQLTVAVQYKVARAHGEPLEWTLWDRFEMEGAGLTLEGFLTTFKQQHGLEVTMMSYGKSLLYAEFLSKKKLQERMRMLLLELVETVGKVPAAGNLDSLTFSISCSDANDEDVEVPDITVQIR
eukprot:SM000027S09616  [mRNA]  locus=s27:375938:382308:- [translate_table: standard]